MEQISNDKKRPAESETGDAAARKSKKGKSKSRSRVAANAEISLGPEHFIKAHPLSEKPESNDASRPVQLSSRDKATQLILSEDKLTVSGNKGYRTVRCTHGVHEGAWYCEVKVEHLGEDGHCRLGWATRKAEIQAPVGCDMHGFSYRDLEGTKVHKGLREPYGEPYAQGDVIGLLIHLPPGGKKYEQPIVRYKNALYTVEDADQAPQPFPGSFVAFTKNGMYQQAAYIDIPEGTYYPAASLYSLPKQAENPRVTFNFGPNFTFQPPTLEICPAFRAFCELSSAASQAGPASEAPSAAPTPRPDEQPTPEPTP